MKVHVSGNTAYLTNSDGEKFHIVDVSTPTSPSEISSLVVGYPPNGFFVSGSCVYCTGGRFIDVIDVSAPDNPQKISCCEIGYFGMDIYVSGYYAYVATYDYGFDIVDISLPCMPRVVTSIEKRLFNATFVYISGNYAYLGETCSSGPNPLEPAACFRIFDITDPTMPNEIWHCNRKYISGIYISENYVYCADMESLNIIDISNPNMPQFVSSIPMDAGSGIHGSGNYIYITDRQDSLHVIDVSIPSSPQKVGYFTTQGYQTTDVYAADTYIYLAAKNGLYILQNDILTNVKNDRTQAPAMFRLYQNYPNPFNPTTSVSYELQKAMYVQLTISDICGCHIRTLVNHQQNPGRYQTVWDGTNEQGLPVSAGIYFCKMQANQSIKIIKMILVR